MKRVVGALALLALGSPVLGACVHVTVREDQVRNETPDCSGGHAPLTMTGQIQGTPVASHPIADSPGKTLTQILLTVPPGAKAFAHKHSGVVLGYVLEGAVCSQINTDAGLKPYTAGQGFFEPPGSQHIAFFNPGIVTAKVLVTQVADTGAPPTIPVQ